MPNELYFSHSKMNNQIKIYFVLKCLLYDTNILRLKIVTTLVLSKKRIEWMLADFVYHLFVFVWELEFNDLMADFFTCFGEKNNKRR